MSKCDSKEPRPRGTGHSPASLWDEPGVLFCMGVFLTEAVYLVATFSLHSKDSWQSLAKCKNFY